MNALCRTKEEIERLAFHLHCVLTDNRDALVALGFERQYPQVASGYESSLWVRAVDAGSNAGTRKLVVQRAYLDRPSAARQRC